MDKTVIKVENLSKEYRFGVIGHATLCKDIQAWWARIRGKEDPNSKISLHSGPALTGERFWALKDISFEVKKGEVLGIIGCNGAGKSTLLKILSRVTTPTEGIIKVKGRIASLLEVGTGFHPELTGRENVYLNGMLHGMSKTEVKNEFDEIVDFSGVERFIDTPVKRYSSGMKVRLGFAVAAHLKPEILIVDEVLAVGDAEFRRKCLGKMRDVSEGGRTVLFVSHNMNAIRQLCHRAIILGGGKLVDSGPTDDIVDKYLALSSSGQCVNQDIPPELHPKPNLDVELCRIELLDTTGNIIDTVKSDQDFCLKAYLKFNKSMACKVLIAFWNTNGLLISRIAYPDNEQLLNGKAGDLIPLTIRIKNIFVPGKYTISAGFRDKRQVIIDRVEGVFFDISPSVAGDTSGYHKGLIQLQADWSL